MQWHSPLPSSSSPHEDYLVHQSEAGCLRVLVCLSNMLGTQQTKREILLKTGSRDEQDMPTTLIVNNQPLDGANESRNRRTDAQDLGSDWCGLPHKIVHAIGETGCCTVVDGDLERVGIVPNAAGRRAQSRPTTINHRV